MWSIKELALRAPYVTGSKEESRLSDESDEVGGIVALEEPAAIEELEGAEPVIVRKLGLLSSI